VCYMTQLVVVSLCFKLIFPIYTPIMHKFKPKEYLFNPKLSDSKTLKKYPINVRLDT